MTDKRKNINMIAPTYEEGRLFRFARQRQWTREETFVINASPDECFAHIRSVPSRYQRWDCKTKGQQVGEGYDFKVELERPRSFPSGKKAGDTRLIVGQIVPYEGDGQRSLIRIRTYPHVTPRTRTIAYFWFIMPILFFAGFDIRIQGISVSVFLVGVALWSFFLLALDTFGSRQQGLDIVRTIFTGKREA